MKKIIKEPSLWLLIFLVGFPQVSETIYTPSLPELAERLHASGSAIQQTLSIYFLGFAAGVILWGILSDKIGRRPSILYGILVYILGSVGCLLSTTVEMLLLFRFVQAFGAATGSVVTQTIMRDCYDDARRPIVFAKISAVLAFSPAIGPLIGGQVAEALGVEYVFLTLVLIGLVAGVFSYFMLGETRPAMQQTAHSLISVGKRMLCDKHIWIYGAFIGLINGIIFSYYAEAPFLFINHLGLSVAQYGYLGVVVALASFVGAVVGKKLIQSYSVMQVMRIGYGVMLLGTSIILLAILAISSSMLLLLFILIGVFLLMSGIGIALPSCLSNALVSYRDCLGISGACLGLYYYLIVSLSTWSLSLLHSGSMLVLPLFLFALSSFLLLLTWARNK